MLEVHNTLTNRKQTFVPIEAGKIRIYVCGMTVYDYCHIGHARVMVAFDVIVRYLRYRGFEVNYVRNITDVDDKIIQRAAANGETPEQLTQRFIAAMHEDERQLNVLPPTQEPKATQHMDDIITMVQTLIDKGFAYKANNGDVYYRVDKFTNYGALTNRKLEDMRAGSRVDIDTNKENPLDFVLWKTAKAGEVSWSSPWGDGRPGWHIECSAMSKCCLGEHFDIHGGGPDLPFPHHENEIAQSEAANDQTFVNYWLHAGAVRVDQEKMSKSLGNFFTIREVLVKYPAEVIRYLLTASHYRSQIDYSEDSMKEAHSGLSRFYVALQDISIESHENIDSHDCEYTQRFHQAMDDDFNTRKAIAVLFELARDINRLKPVDNEQATHLALKLRRLGGVLGLLQENPGVFLRTGGEQEGHADQAISDLVAQRDAAKKSKDFALADCIRAQLLEQGIVVEDNREGTRWRRQ